MFPYWMLFSVFAVAALNGTRRLQIKSQSPLLLAAGFATILFIGLRHQTGGDWGNYIAILRATPSDLALALSYGDPGYMFLNWLARRLDLGLWFVNLCCGAIFTWGLLRLARSEPNPWLTIAVAVPYLIIVVGMGYTRQAVSIGFIMAAMVAFTERRLLLVAVLAVLATLFHKTAFIVFPLMALAVVKNRFVIWGLLGGVTLLLFFGFFAQFLERFTQSYIESEMASEGAAVRVAMNVLPALLFLTVPYRFSRTLEERKMLRNFSLAALVALAGLFLLQSTTVVDRLALYLLPLQLIILGRIPFAFSRSERQSPSLAIFVLLYSAAILFVWLTYAIHARAWLPYRSLIFAG